MILRTGENITKLLFGVIYQTTADFDVNYAKKSFINLAAGFTPTPTGTQNSSSTNRRAPMFWYNDRNKLERLLYETPV
jgi:hypothetical protein